MVSLLGIGVLFIGSLLTMVSVILFLWMKGYNIPVTILRFVGGKGRPTLIQTKAKKWVRKGVARLRVKGYKMAIRDFRAENYYPALKSKFGGLILWEFEDGLLTPALPTKVPLPPERKKEFADLVAQLSTFQSVGFEFDGKLHETLKLHAVDDVDIDFMLQEYARIGMQYVSGIGEFFMKYGGHMALAIVSVALLIGVILFFQKAPEIASACAQAGVSGSETFIKEVASKVGLPPG